MCTCDYTRTERSILASVFTVLYAKRTVTPGNMPWPAHSTGSSVISKRSCRPAKRDCPAIRRSTPTACLCGGQEQQFSAWTAIMTSLLALIARINPSFPQNPRRFGFQLLDETSVLPVVERISHGRISSHIWG